MKFFKYILMIFLSPTFIFAQGSGNNLIYSSQLNSTSRIVIPNAISFNHPGNNISIEVWIFVNNLTGGCIFSKHETNFRREYDLFLLNDGRIRFGLFDNLDSEFITNSTNAINLNQWTHISATYSSTSGIANININGNLDATNNIGIINIASTNIRPLIGAYWLPNGLNSRGHFNGNIDELRLWHSVRTIDQIRTNMCKKINAPQPNLIAYYNFDEVSGNIAADISGNNNNGTLQNFPAAQIATRNFSGAPIGDASIHQYTNSWNGITLLLASAPPGANEGSFRIDNITGAASPNGFHLFRVDALPSQTIGLTSPAPTYFGTFVVGGNGITYQAIYDYTASIYINPTCEPFYRLSERNDNSNSTWNLLNAPLNITLNTLTATNLNSRKEIILQPSCTILPLEFLSFNLTLQENELDLDWTTANEINTNSFIIERSSDSKLFYPIGSIESNNIQTITNKYFFTDQNPLLGISYYRIKQVDINGEYSYSTIKCINRNDINEIKIFPNPGNGIINLNFSEGTNIIIKDCNGKIVFENTNSYNDSKTHQQIDLTHLSAGLYFVHFISNENSTIKKLLLE